MVEWDDALTKLSRNFEEDSLNKEKKELAVVFDNEEPWTSRDVEEEPYYTLKPLILTIPLCVVDGIFSAWLYFFVNEELGIAVAAAVIPTLFWTVYAIFHPAEQDDKKKKKKKVRNFLKDSSLFKNIKEIENLLENRDNKKLAKQLKQIRKKAVALEDVIPTQSQYELFIQTRLEMYIMPYLEYIAKYDGKLNKADQQRFEETFGKLEAVLDTKKKSEIDAWSDSKKVEMDVTEKELDNVLSEYKQRQGWQ